MQGDFLPNLPAAWRLPFSENAIARGQQYAAENRIRIVREDSRYVEATCRGSAGSVYRQSLELSRDGRLSCICS